MSTMRLVIVILTQLHFAAGRRQQRGARDVGELMRPIVRRGRAAAWRGVALGEGVVVVFLLGDMR